MNTNIVITLDTRRQKKDKTYPLIMRLGHNERTTSIQLGINLLEKDWDEKNRVIRKTYEGVNTVSRLNNLIQKKKADAMDIIFKLHESKQLPLLSITILRERIEQQERSQSFFKYGEALVTELKKANRIGTPRRQEKCSTTLTLQNKVMTQNFSRNFKKTSGNLERSSAVCKLGYLHFGIKTKKPKH